MALIMAVAAGIASCSIFTGPGNDTSKVKVTGTGVAVLANLGVPTKLAPRTQVGGAAMLDSENPFGKNVIDTKVINEIFTISQDNKAKLINVPGVSAGTATDLPVNIVGLGGTDGQIKRPVAADLDGDGKKEILMANFNITAKTIGFFKINRGTSYAVQGAGQISWDTKRSWSDGRDNLTYWHWAGIFWVNDSSVNPTRDWNQFNDIASGDIDGDGRDEVVISSEGTLYVLDHDLSLKKQQDIPLISASSPDTQILRVACGDLNGDGTAEIVVTNGTFDANKTAQVSVYSYSAGALTSLLSGGAIGISTASKNLRSAAVAIGDVDGDKKPEIVLAGIEDSAAGCITMILNVDQTSGVWTNSFVNTVKTSALKSMAQNYWAGWTGPQQNDAMVPILALGDLDGDGKDEIVSNDDVLAVTVSLGNATLDYAFTNGNNILRQGLAAANLPGTAGIWGNFTYGNVAWAADRIPDTAYNSQVKMGDLNGDGKEEIVVLDYKRAVLRTYSCQNNVIIKNSDISITTDDTDNSNFCKYLCLADVNNDGASYKYNGHALIFSAPVIVGVISGPPYWNVQDPKNPGSLIQDTSQMQTSFGLSAGASVGIGGSVEVAVSGKIGASGVLPVASNGEAKATVEITGGFSAGFDAELTGSMKVSYLCPAGVDKVMFFSVPIDVWEYENVNNAADKFYIKEPRKPEMQYVDVSWYNDNNGDYPDIDAGALKNHVIGKPYTYPTFAQATSLFQALPGASFLIQTLQNTAGMVIPGVPEGNGNTVLEYSVGGSVGASFSVFGEVKYEQECSFIGLVGASASVKIEGHVSRSTSVETWVGGSVEA